MIYDDDDDDDDDGDDEDDDDDDNDDEKSDEIGKSLKNDPWSLWHALFANNWSIGISMDCENKNTAKLEYSERITLMNKDSSMVT